MEENQNRDRDRDRDRKKERRKKDILTSSKAKIDPREQREREQ